MSSNDEDYGGDYTRGKKRRIARACDVCRRRKSRCDGSGLPGDKCSTCVDAKTECTYVEAAAKRVPARTNYVESLESRLERSEALVRQLRAELASAHFNSTATGAGRGTPSTSSKDSPSAGSIGSPTTDDANPPIQADRRMASLLVMRAALRALSAPTPPPHADDLLHLELARKFDKLHMGENGVPKRHFIGKSSGVVLIKAAIDAKAHVRRGEQRGRKGSEDAGRAGAGARVAMGEGVFGGNSANANASASVNGLKRKKAGKGPVVCNITDLEGAGADAENGDDDDEDEDEEDVGEGVGMWTSRRLQYWTFKPE
ncbi:hypothetical protein B0H11DRAFT_1365644 [Mycena galericulata]|nr:hypothetical protein B0H11DRAFT_1365644 [Mycena galericulata]